MTGVKTTTLSVDQILALCTDIQTVADGVLVRWLDGQTIRTQILSGDDLTARHKDLPYLCAHLAVLPSNCYDPRTKGDALRLTLRHWESKSVPVPHEGDAYVDRVHLAYLVRHSPYVSLDVAAYTLQYCAVKGKQAGFSVVKQWKAANIWASHEWVNKQWSGSVAKLALLEELGYDGVAVCDPVFNDMDKSMQDVVLPSMIDPT